MGFGSSEEKCEYSQVPTTIVTGYNDQEMSAGTTTMRVVLWLIIKTINILWVPAYLIKLLKKSNVCPPIQDKILLLSATELADKIRKQEITSERVIRSYIARIQEVNPVINAVIEDRFVQAIEDAKYADKIITFGSLSVQELKEKHPLLGVPITVKGSIEVEGMKSTSGMVCRANVEATKDAVAVKHARDAGAIPMLTSNIPELCMNWESSNKLRGTTKNPHCTTKTPGGSSGGEASLLASACSVIGIGSDIAGSLRLPAHFCGVWGHKPSPGAISYVGHYPSCTNHEVWEASFTLGPMARYATDLKFLLGIIIEPKMKDVLKLNEPVNLKELKIYYMGDIQSLLTDKVNRNCLDALNKVIGHLNSICHTNCEQVKLPLMKYAPELASLALLDIDGIDNLFSGRGDGSFCELCRFAVGRSKSTFTSVAYGILRKLTGYLPRSMIEQAKETLKEFKWEFEKLLGDDGVFVMPTFPVEAPHHGEIITKLFDSGYLSIFNSLGLPVTSCPVTFTSKGLPVGVQVVGAPNCDRLTLAVALEIEKVFGGWRPPSAVNQATSS